MPDLFAGPYVFLEPDFAFVLDDGCRPAAAYRDRDAGHGGAFAASTCLPPGWPAGAGAARACTVTR